MGEGPWVHGMMCGYLDEVMMCLVGPHPTYVEVVLSHVPVEGWVINSDVHGLPDGPSGARYLPAYDSQAVHSDRMSHGLAVLIDGEGLLTTSSWSNCC